MRGVAEDPASGGPERMPDRESAAMDVDAERVEVGQQPRTGEHLRGEGPAKLHEVDVRPRPSGSAQSAVGRFDRHDPEDFGLIVEDVPPCDTSQRIGVQDPRIDQDA
jgi:hypothetical protein